MRLTHCIGSGNQRWFMDASSRLRPYHAPSKCLDIRNGALIAVGFCRVGCNPHSIDATCTA